MSRAKRTLLKTDREWENERLEKGGFVQTQILNVTNKR